MNDDLISLRRALHSCPELAFEESKTASLIKKYIDETYKPSKWFTNVGGTGLIAEYDSGVPGPSVVFRADLDAIPVQSNVKADYRSQKANVAHACGHDGHMTMVAGIANLLKENPIQKGKVLLLFQPAEEIGAGSTKMIHDDKFSIEPDYIFALHNIPGYEEGVVITRKNVFAAASVGLKINLQGHTSHAAFPEDAKSPVPAIAELILRLKSIMHHYNELTDFAIITVIHINVGEKAFGTTPGEGQIYLTVRASDQLVYNSMIEDIYSLADEVSSNENLKHTIEKTEEFKATENNEQASAILEKAIIGAGLKQVKQQSPFRWSEDFGEFTSLFPGAMFGLGAGENQPQLHHPDFDFNENIILAGIRVYEEIINQLNR